MKPAILVAFLCLSLASCEALGSIINTGGTREDGTPKPTTNSEARNVLRSLIDGAGFRANAGPWLQKNYPAIFDRIDTMPKDGVLSLAEFEELLNFDDPEAMAMTWAIIFAPGLK